jgi:hypothetical protein
MIHEALRMKLFSLLSAILLMPLVAVAQDATLLDDQIDHGLYGGLITKVTPINGQAGFMVGAEATWIVDRELYVGAQVLGIANEVDAVKLQSNGTPYLMWANEIGGRAGYILNSEDLVHFSAGALVGAGSLQLADRYPWTDPADVETVGDQDYYLIVEPEVAAELNVAPWMRAKVAGSYRIVNGAETEGVTNGDLSGPAGSLTLMFGSF